MKSIFEKSEVYRTQMAPVEKLLLDFALRIGWKTQSRGRKANASIYGKIGKYNGVLDILIEEDDWDKLPDKLSNESIFTIWCGAYFEENEKKSVVNRELYWRTTYGELQEVVPKFISYAETMFESIKEDSELISWSGASINPDIGPNYGPPRNRSKI